VKRLYRLFLFIFLLIISTLSYADGFKDADILSAADKITVDGKTWITENNGGSYFGDQFNAAYLQENIKADGKIIIIRSYLPLTASGMNTADDVVTNFILNKYYKDIRYLTKTPDMVMVVAEITYMKSLCLIGVKKNATGFYGMIYMDNNLNSQTTIDKWSKIIIDSINTASEKNNWVLAHSEPDPASQPQIPKNLNDVVIKMERSCCSPYPEYSLTINGNGTVDYDGRSNVDVVGKKTYQIPHEDVKKLIQLIYGNYFFAIPDKFHAGASGVWTRISVTDGIHTKYLDYDTKVPTVLTELEHAIDITAKVSDLIGKRESRPADQGQHLRNSN
jgi:hypothetical protein